jgi:hypothetical protein
VIIQHYPDELDYVNARLHPLHPDEVDEDKSFVTTFCLACLRADGINYELLRPVLAELMIRYPANPDRLDMERRDRVEE